MLVAASLMASADAGASPGAVRTEGCDWLDPHELARLTRLELDEASEDVTLMYTCQDKAVTIAIASTASGLSIQRKVVDACCDQVERERTLALLAAGLFRAAAPLLKEPAPGSGDTTAERAATRAAEPAPTVAAAVPPPPAPVPVAPAPLQPVFVPTLASSTPVAPAAEAFAAPRDPDYPHRLGLDGQLRFYNLASPVTLAGLSAHYGYRIIPDVSVGLFGEATLGGAKRTGGEIDVRVFHVGLGADWRFVHVAPLSLTGRLRGAGSIVQLEGNAKSDVFAADSITGGTGSVMLALIPAVSTGRAELALPLELAFVFRAPRGLVESEPELRVDGVSFGAALSVTFGVGAPMGQRPVTIRAGAR